MISSNKKKSGSGEPEKSQERGSDDTGSPQNVKAAYEQAEEDIKQDADLSIHSQNDDLDEGETARLGEDKNDLI